jgi:hypothetical protein
VVARVRDGYQSQLGRLDGRLEVLRFGRDVDGVDPGGEEADPGGNLQAERRLRNLVIDAERTELGLLVARRKVSERVAVGVRAALDVEETTMRP